MLSISDINYYLFKAYLQLFHDTLLLRHRYVEGLENLPPDGTRYIIVCNHQNTGNDPFNILFGLPFSVRISAMSRANMFDIHPLFSRFISWLGVVPAFRFGFEGGAQLQDNFHSFEAVGRSLERGRPFVIFPEAGHTQGHYLNRFTSGTVRIALNAAQHDDFRHDIQILPIATHYSDYFDIQHDIVLRLAKPISLQPYYEEFSVHPNTVLRTVTHQMHDTIQQLMLDEGATDYEERDFMRNSAFNPATLTDMPLPERLEQDKAFVARLIAHPAYSQIIPLARQLREAEERLGVSDQMIVSPPHALTLVVEAIALLCLLPLWLVSLWPHAICYRLPLRFLRTDRMFTNTYRYFLSMLVLYPLTFLLSVLVLWL